MTDLQTFKNELFLLEDAVAVAWVNSPYLESLNKLRYRAYDLRDVLYNGDPDFYDEAELVERLEKVTDRVHTLWNKAFEV